MGYYHRGDYYRGDYYRGDPWLGPLLAVGRAALPAIGRVASAVGRAVGIGRAGAAAGTVAGSAIPTIARQAGRVLPRAGRVAATIGTGVATVGIADRIFGDDDDGQPRRRRRMNVANVKALRRALRRAEGFEKIARRTVSALHRGPKKFKSQRRAS